MKQKKNVSKSKKEAHVNSLYLEKVVDLTIYHIDENEGQYVLEENSHNRVASHMKINRFEIVGHNSQSISGSPESVALLNCVPISASPVLQTNLDVFHLS